MKFYLHLILIFLVSCSSTEKEDLQIENTPTQTIDNGMIKNNPEPSFDEVQDTLRQILWHSKPNEILKTSLLEELYLRGQVHQEGELLSFNLTFDLHGLDCGAPDCYTTAINFSTPLTQTVILPKNELFTVHEHGCVDAEFTKKAEFELVEQSPTFFNYYSVELKSNLVYLKQNHQLFYFVGVAPREILVDNIPHLLENYNEENPSFQYPYQSTVMNSNEYENFIED